VLLRRTRTAGQSLARLWLFLFLATASHGVLDAMTNGGLGVAFFAPFSDTRYFFPWHPIVVSPISISEFFGPRGLRVIWSELGWIWAPSAVVFLVGLALRQRSGKSGVESGRRRPSLE
jgi:inner membrane protein